MKPDKVFIGNIKRCTKYISHSRFTGNVFIGEECVSLNSFGYIESEDELYKEKEVQSQQENPLPIKQMLKAHQQVLALAFIQLDQKVRLVSRLYDENNMILEDFEVYKNTISVDDIVDLLSIDLIGVVPDDEYIITQTNKGEPVIQNRKAPSGKAYLEIAKRVLGENIEVTIPGREKGFLSRIKSIFKK